MTAEYDLLAARDSFTEWLAGMSQPADLRSPSLHDLALAVEFREALRDLVAVNSGTRPTAAAVEVVNRAAGVAALNLGFGHQGITAVLTSPASGLEGALARILVAVYGAMSDGSWSRLKVCGNPDCRWAFYDRSRNRSRVWCEMRECGNRMKARRFRQRAREVGRT